MLVSNRDEKDIFYFIPPWGEQKMHKHCTKNEVFH